MKCIYCGEETENIIHNEYVCLSCVNKLYVPCENCGELHDKAEMHETAIGYVCSECLERDFTCCSDCGEWTQNDNIRTVINSRGSEVDVCEQCCDDEYTYCEACGRYVKNDAGTDSTFDGDWRCYECLDDSGYYMYCEGCDTYYRECDMTYSESRQEWLCPDCYEEAEEDDTTRRDD